MLEYCLRDDLKLTANRYMAVLNPIKLVIDNYPEDQVEYLPVENSQENEEAGSREVAFSKYLYIERDDFMEEPPKKKDTPIMNKYMYSEIIWTGIYCALLCILFLKLPIFKELIRDGENNKYLMTAYFAMFISWEYLMHLMHELLELIPLLI